MLLRETGFTFNGKHSMNDFGLQYSEKDAAHPMFPATRWNEYEVAGQSGTVLFGGETYQRISFTGTLYPHREPKTQAEAQQMLRSVQAWLTAGRCPLIFDYEPDKYYMAQLTNRSAWSLKNWFGGELGITFTAEPFAYAVRETVFQQEITEETELSLRMVTLRPAPTIITIQNKGTVAMTGASINDGRIEVANISNFPTNYILTIRSEPPVNITMQNIVGEWSALMRCTSFYPHSLEHGANTLKITPAFADATGTKKCLVTVRARGRW